MLASKSTARAGIDRRLHQTASVFHHCARCRREHQAFARRTCLSRVRPRHVFGITLPKGPLYCVAQKLCIITLAHKGCSYLPLVSLIVQISAKNGVILFFYFSSGGGTGRCGVPLEAESEGVLFSCSSAWSLVVAQADGSGSSELRRRDNSA